jgi:hypothetical protein
MNSVCTRPCGMQVGQHCVQISVFTYRPDRITSSETKKMSGSEVEKHL